MFDVTRLNCLGAAGVTAIGLGILLTADHAIAQAPASNAPSSRPMAAAEPLWVDVTANAIGVTKFWTNKVEIADLNGDGRPDLLFANGGDYSTPGTPEPNQVFLHTGAGFRFTEAHDAGASARRRTWRA